MKRLFGCIYNIQRFSIHDGPGIRTTVFFKGCPLRCPWCSNPESQDMRPEPIWDNVLKKEIITGNYYSINEVMNIILKDIDYYEESGGGVTISGGEVLAQKEFSIELLKVCKKNKIHTACETSAYSSTKNFEELIDNLDLLIMDIKHYDENKHIQKTGVSLVPILKNLDLSVRKQKPMLLRIPIIPYYNNSLKDAHEFGKFLQTHHIRKVELLPFHQFGKSKYRFLGRTYEFQEISQIMAKDLLPYAEIIKQFNIECIIA